MRFDLFISYAWTNEEHREWVRLLAAHLRTMGFIVGIDEDVKYGESLNGFMRKIREAEHVLMIVDENYVYRADNVPDSGVAFENRVLEDAASSKPANWIAPLLVRNPEGALPRWLANKNPKYFDFRSYPNQNDFPGSSQIEDLWRWLSGLSSDKTYAISPAVIRERMRRVELVDSQRDPSNWSFPRIYGQDIAFNCGDAPRDSIMLGSEPYDFVFEVSSCSENSIYIYADHVKAVGLIPIETEVAELTAREAFGFIGPGRSITPQVNQSAVLMNAKGCLCIVTIRNVTTESSVGSYVKPCIVFDYRILLEETDDSALAQEIK